LNKDKQIPIDKLNFLNKIIVKVDKLTPYLILNYIYCKCSKGHINNSAEYNYFKIKQNIKNIDDLNKRISNHNDQLLEYKKKINDLENTINNSSTINQKTYNKYTKYKDYYKQKKTR